MTSIVLGAAGAIVGGMVGGAAGAQWGWSIGSSIGGMMEDGPNTQGPRITDLQVQGSTYGSSIPIYYGTARGAGQVIWSSDLIEVTNEESSGGKGDGPTYTSYTYFVNCAVGVCEGEISGISRIWANGELIYDTTPDNTNHTGQSNRIRIYTGSESQVPDSLLEAYLGAGNVPAHRGQAYVVFEMFPLEKYGNRLPNFTFEVVKRGTNYTQEYEHISNQGVLRVFPHPYVDGLVLSPSNDLGDSSSVTLHVVDLISKTDRVISMGDVPATYCTYDLTHVLVKDPVTELVILDEIWLGYDTFYSGYSNILAIALDTNSLSISRIIRTASPNLSFVGNFHFDRATNKVLVATRNSTIGDGYNILDPFTLKWSNPTFRYYSGGDWWTGRGVEGKRSIALCNYYNHVGIFIGGHLVARISSAVGIDTTITYDSKRERYVWYNGYQAGDTNMRFKSVDEDGLEINEHFPTTIGLPGWSAYSLNYFPVADKYVLCDRYRVLILNADTFEPETVRTVVVYPGAARYATEIPGMPEYVGLGVNDTTKDGIARVPITDRLSSEVEVLGDIVTDICGRVGLNSSDISVSQLTDPVEGFIITQQMTARAAIESLQSGYFFDAVESD